MERASGAWPWGRRLAAAVVSLGVTTGCAAGDGSGMGSSALTTIVPATAPGPSATVADLEVTTTVAPVPTTPTAPAALDWSAPLIGGGAIDMRGYVDRAVMLWFWAPY